MLIVNRGIDGRRTTVDQKAHLSFQLRGSKVCFVSGDMYEK